MDSDTRRNFFAYYLSFIVMAVAGFIVNPILLAAFGPVMFGVWKSLQKFLDFAAVADGQASQALKWIVATRSGYDAEERRRDIGAAITVWVRWLPATTLVVAAVTVAMPLLIRGIPHDMREAAYTTAAVLAANTDLAGLLSVPHAVLVGVNQGYKTMLVTTAALVLANAAMVAAAIAGAPLWSLAAIVLVSAMANAAVTLFVARRAVPWWGVSPPTKPDVRRVLGYSTWTLGWIAADKLLLACELIVISITAGALMVAKYTFTTYMTQFVLAIAMVTASGFIPKLGALLGGNQFEEAARAAKTLRHMVIGVIVLGCSAILAFNGSIVTLWVGRDQYLGTTLNTLLVVCALQFAFIRMDGQILDVTMRMGPKVVVGFVSSAGGIVAATITYAMTHDLVPTLVAIIAVRLIGNVTFPILVTRAIPGSAMPRRSLPLAGALLTVSLAFAPMIEAGLLPVQWAALLWLPAAAAACWFGLVPKAAMQALMARRSPTRTR